MYGFGEVGYNPYVSTVLISCALLTNCALKNRKIDHEKVDDLEDG